MKFKYDLYNIYVQSNGHKSMCVIATIVIEQRQCLFLFQLIFSQTQSIECQCTQHIYISSHCRWNCNACFKLTLLQSISLCVRSYSDCKYMQRISFGPLYLLYLILSKTISSSIEWMRCWLSCRAVYAKCQWQCHTPTICIDSLLAGNQRIGNRIPTGTVQNVWVIVECWW